MPGKLITPDKILRSQYYNLTYVIYSRVQLRADTNTPWDIQVITEQHKEGDFVTLKQPSVLDPSLAGYNVFTDGWTDTKTGQKNIQFAPMTGDVLIEGRVERMGMNLLRNTQFPIADQLPSLPDARCKFWMSSAPGSNRTPTIQNENGYNSIKALNINTTSGQARVSGVPTVPYDIPEDTALIFSFQMRSEFADTGWMISNVSGRSLKIFVDGVEVPLNTATNLGDGNTHIVEHVFKLHWVRNDSPSFNGVFANTEYYPDGNSPVMVEISKIGATGRRFYVWLPKLEDVTGLPEADQRATPWVKHVNDIE